MTAPNFPNTLINEPGENSLSGVGTLKGLLGTWTSPRGANCQGYNVMPLPQDGKIITKNFLYFEELTFTSPGIAPNRGGDIQQDCAALTYEQRVYFGQGPSANKLVHFENGLLINTTFAKQGTGAYGKAGTPGSQPEPANYEFPIAKQVSVPHGNSILAAGKVGSFTGAPDISAPHLSVPPFGPANIPNPNQALIDRNKNLANKGVEFGSDGVVLTFSTENGPGAGVKNIAFEQGHARVTCYETTLWLVSLSYKGIVTPQLQYTQTIWMELFLNGRQGPSTLTAHIDANSLMLQGAYIDSDNLSATQYPVLLDK